MTVTDAAVPLAVGLLGSVAEKCVQVSWLEQIFAVRAVSALLFLPLFSAEMQATLTISLLLMGASMLLFCDAQVLPS